MRNPFAVSHRAGKMEYILSGCSSRGNYGKLHKEDVENNQNDYNNCAPRQPLLHIVAARPGGS